MGILADMLSFSFICRALVVGIFVAVRDFTAAQRLACR